jgi:predicted DNA-binding transcriptional regulator AlpA
VSATELLEQVELYRQRQQQQRPASGFAPIIFLSRAQVCRRLGISISSMYRKIADGLIPPPVYLGPGCARWPEGEIDACQRQLMDARAARRP